MTRNLLAILLVACALSAACADMGSHSEKEWVVTAPSGVQYKFSYRLKKNEAILCGRFDVVMIPCVSPRPVGRLVVPDEIDGHKVTELGKYAFAHCTDMTEIVLPKGLRHVGHGAFLNCRNLKELVCPDSVKTLGTTSTFYMCLQLRRIDIANCTGASLRPGEYVPEGMGGLFDSCRNLSEITVSPSNAVFMVKDGALYSRDGSTLYVYPKTREELALLPETRVIEVCACAGCGFRRCKVPEGVEKISASAFNECEMMERIDLPRSLRSVGNAAFSVCSWLNVVYFAGPPPYEVGNCIFSDTNPECEVKVGPRAEGWPGPSSWDKRRWPWSGVNGGKNSRKVVYTYAESRKPADSNAQPQGRVP